MGRIKFTLRLADLSGQSTIEFTFTMIVIVFLVLGMVGVLRWAGTDLAERRLAHDQTLVNVDATTTEEQLNPDFYRPKHMDVFYEGNLTK